MAYTIGIDLGGTKIAGAIMDVDSGVLVGELTLPTEAQRGPDEVIARMATLARELCQRAGLRLDEIAAVGLGAAGVTDNDAGKILLVANFPGDWSGKPVAPLLSDQLGRPVWLINDAHAFTLAEANRGAGQGAKTVACFTLGTGVGGGFAADGRVYMGQDGAAGIFGHHTIEPNGLICGCGNRGCLETLVSGPAIAAQGVRAVLHGANTRISELVEHDVNRVTPEVIMRAAESGDAVAREILARAGDYLGIGVANIVTILSPHRVVIGGGVAQLGEWLLAPARAMVRARCFTAPVDKIEIVRASLGGRAGVVGAAVWAWQREND